MPEAQTQTQTFFIKDEDSNEILEFALYTKKPVDFQPRSTPEPINENNEYEFYGAREEAIASMQEVHKHIRFYTKYAIDAFKNFAGAEIEEVNLKFGLKSAGKSGIPMLTEGSGEANFEVQVKCKFPKNDNANNGEQQD